MDQAGLNALLDQHQRFIDGRPGGQRAIRRFLQAPRLEFSKRDLTDADLTGANLEGARMIMVQLERGSLYCADLRSVDLRCANLRRADLRGASLKHSTLAGANLDEIDMRRAVLARANVPDGFKLAGRSAEPGEDQGEIAYSVDMSNCSLKLAKLSNAKLKNVNLSGALLHGADLRGANLMGANLTNAVLIGANLRDVRIDPADLANCILDPGPDAAARAPALMAAVDGAELWALSHGDQGRPAVLDGEDLRPMGRIFEKRRLTALSARRAQAIGVSFVGAQLQGARFDGADLRGADFSEADLRGANFDGANLWHARFDQADLRTLCLARGGERPVSLRGVEIAPNGLSRAWTDPGLIVARG